MFWFIVSLVLFALLGVSVYFIVFLAKIVFSIEETISDAIRRIDKVDFVFEEIIKLPIIVASDKHQNDYRLALDEVKRLKIDILLVADSFTKLSKKQYEELMEPTQEQE